MLCHLSPFLEQCQSKSFVSFRLEAMGRAGVLQTMAASECGCEQMYGLMRIQIQISVLIQQQSSYIFIFGDLNFLLFADHIGATVIVSRNMTTMVIYDAQNNFK